MEATQEGLTIISSLQHYYCQARGCRCLSSTSSVSLCYWKSERKYLWKKHRCKRGKSSTTEAIKSQNLLQAASQASFKILFPYLFKGTINFVLSMFMLLKHNILTNCGKRYKLSTPRHKTVFSLPKYLSKAGQDFITAKTTRGLQSWPLQVCKREIPDFTTGGLC